MANLSSYTLIVEGYDWGPAANKVILPVSERLSSVQKEDFNISVSKEASCNGEQLDPITGERSILDAFVSDAGGHKVDKGNYITLELSVGPTMGIASPMQYIPACRGNVWTDYTMEIVNKSTKQMWGEEADRIHPLIDKFDLTGRFTHKNITLSYADFTPKIPQAKYPLIIWLHGGGEGGTDPTIPLLANRAANYASSGIQSYFEGAYVLVPQSPTFWMDKGNGEYTRGDMNDIYNESLMALFKDYVAKHPNIDQDRIYVGGCSNGGYMSLKLLLQHPDYFAASFPSALAYHAANISDQEIESIKDMPIWFIHSKDDGVTKADETVIPVYERLMNAGAGNVHCSLYDHVTDITGMYGGEDYKYIGHFSWIYSHANHCTLDYDGSPVLHNGKPTTIMEWLAAQRKQS